MKIFISGSSHDDIPQIYKDLANEVVNLFSKDNTIIVGGIPATFPKDSMMGIYDNYFNNHIYITVKKYDYPLKPKESEVLYYTFDRTKDIYNLADVIILLPGGIGTMAETFSFIEEARTNECKKEIYLLNTTDISNYIFNLINCGIVNNFLQQSDLNNIAIVDDVKELKKK